MTSKGGTKQQVTLFYMSQHFGICSPVDVITAITINEKLAWSGNVSSLSSFTIDNGELFGGATKQGGVKGTVYFLPGAGDQVLPDNLAVKLGRANGADCPGYRGLASIFMTGPADGQAGFYWTANDPYLPGVWVTVRRAPVGLDPDFALIPRGTGTGLIAISAGTSCELSWWQATYDQTLLGDPPGVNDQARMGIGFLDSGGALIGSVTWATLIDPDPPMVFVNRTVSETSPSGAYQVRIYMEMSKRRGVNNDGYIDDISLTVGGVAADIINPGAEAGSTSGWTAEVGGIALRSTSPSPHSGSAYFFGSAFPLARVYQDVYSPIGGLDANPAHMIYECLTNNDWGMGSPSSLIDVASFEAAGEALYLEGLGLSMIWTRQDTIQNFVQEVLDHIQGVLFADPQSGLLTLKLIRGDYNVDALPTISPSTANLSNFGRKLWGDIVNEINVTWTNPTNEQDETVTAHDLASIATQGGIVSDSRNYYGCRYSDLAMRLAMRDLRSAGAPLASCDAEVDRSLWYLQPASVLLVDWPEYGLDGVVMRVTGVDYGKPGDPTIKLSLIEDVFGLDAADYISPPTTLWDEPAAVPTPVDQSVVLTLPYFFAANGITDIAGAAYPEVLAGVLAATSNTDTYGYELWSQVTLTDGTTEWEALASLNLVGYGLLSADLAAEAASTGVAFASYVGTILPHQAGFAIFGAAVEGTSEIALITSATTTFDLSRGVLDTVPKAWAAGSPVWFVTTDALIEDPTARSVAETVDYRLRTRTSKGLLSLSAAPDVTDTLTERPWRPSRPANVTIGGVQFNTLATPVNMVGASSVPVSWSERDRATEDSVVLAWTAATVAPETGQTTTITVYATDGTTVLATHSGLTGTSFSIPSGSFAGHSVAIVEVASSRTDADGTFVSLQAQRIYVQLTAFAPAADGASGTASVAFTGVALSARALALSGVASTAFSSSNVTGASISSSGAASASLVGTSVAGPVTGAPQFETANSNTASGNISSITCTFPTTQNNDIALMQVLMMQTTTGTISDPAGWTLIVSDGIGTGAGLYNHKWYWKRCDGSEGGSTVTVNFSGAIGASGEADVAISVWRGCLTSGTPYELQKNARAGNSNLFNAPGMLPIQPTGPDRTIVNAYATSNASITMTSGSGFSSGYDIHSLSASGIKCSYLYCTTPCLVGETVGISGSTTLWGSFSIALLPQTTVSSSTVDDHFMIGSVKLLAGFESGSFVDESPAAHTVSANGAATVNNTAAKFGSYSAVYNGTSTCYHNSANSADWDLLQQWTVEAWVMWPGTVGDGGIAMHWGSAGSDEDWAFFVSGGNLIFRFANQPSRVNLRDVSATFTRTSGTWYHVACDRTADGWDRLYINGTVVASAQWLDAPITGSTQPLEIGNDHLQSTLALNGRIDEIRITKGYARYGGAFTAPTAAYLRS